MERAAAEAATHVVIGAAEARPPDARRVEIVERKGLGHPDTICDAVAEAFSRALSRFYLDRVGRILHHNVDKVLLAAGRSRPRFGGGEVDEPMKLMLAGRAAASCDGVAVPLAEIASEVSREWLGRHLRALDTERHVAVTSLVRPGSPELVELFDEPGQRRIPLANDTSCGVGFAPLSELERLVLSVERDLTADATRRAEPALGEDVKVMAVRRDDAIDLTVACAMIDRALADVSDYAETRERVAQRAREAAARETSRALRVEVNAADDLEAGRIYLTVTGTSGEAGDDGQTGRGNRVNGLITPGRPMTMESVAGKNPVSHVGKLYNLAASLAAERLVAELPGVEGAECRLVSRIGRPIDAPQIVEVGLSGVDPERERDLARAAEEIVRAELDRLPERAEDLVFGRIELDRWPLHA